MNRFGSLCIGAMLALAGSTAAQAALVDLGSLGLRTGGLLESESGTVLVDFSPVLGLTMIGTGGTGATFLAAPLSDTALASGLYGSGLAAGDMLHQGFEIGLDSLGGDRLQFTLDTDGNLSADALLTIVGEFGTNAVLPFDLSGSGFTDLFASYTLQALAPVPLPGGLVLAFGGLGGLMLLRRRGTRRAP